MFPVLGSSPLSSSVKTEAKQLEHIYSIVIHILLFFILNFLIFNFCILQKLKNTDQKLSVLMKIGKDIPFFLKNVVKTQALVTERGSFEVVSFPDFWAPPSSDCTHKEKVLISFCHFHCCLSQQMKTELNLRCSLRLQHWCSLLLIFVKAFQN